MPKQEYVIYTPDAMEGQVYGMSTSANRVTSKAAKNVIGYGKAVKAEADNLIALGSESKTFGVSIRTIGREADRRPSDGVTSYKAEDVVAVMEEGFIVVKNLKGAAVHGAQVYVHPTAGTFAAVAEDGHVASANIRWERGGAEGDLLPIFIGSGILFAGVTRAAVAK